MDANQYIVPGHPPESYSRELDKKVFEQEFPYGYTGNPPSYDHENTASKEQMNRKDY